MAVKTYYGTCTSAATASEKVVVIKSEEITPNGFTFNKGDLLTVYFTESNEAKNPSIVISNNSTEQAVSISTDSGKEIKTRNVQVDAVGAWDAGETVIFAYTGTTGNDNLYYWELVNGAPSTENVYGVTKLFGNAETSVSEWLSLSDPSDYTKALTPGILKKYHNLLIGQESEEEEGQDFPVLKLTWFPAETTGSLIELGKLALIDDELQGIAINYPLEDKIVEVIRKQPKETLDVPENTSELINDGPPEGDSSLNKEDGKFYLTNILPSNKSLYYAGSQIPFLIPNQEQTNNLVLNSTNEIQLNGIKTAINGNLDLGGNLNMSNYTIASGAINCGAITTNGQINAGNNQIRTSGRLDGGTIYENGVSLINKYSRPFKVEHRNTGNFSIGADSTTGHMWMDVSSPGWTPIGVVGFDINEARSSDTPSKCNVWESIIIGSSIMYAVRNLWSKKNTINISFAILYRQV